MLTQHLKCSYVHFKFELLGCMFTVYIKIPNVILKKYPTRFPNYKLNKRRLEVVKKNHFYISL